MHCGSIASLSLLRRCFTGWDTCTVHCTPHPPVFPVESAVLEAGRSVLSATARRTTTERLNVLSSAIALVTLRQEAEVLGGGGAAPHTFQFHICSK